MSIGSSETRIAVAATTKEKEDVARPPRWSLDYLGRLFVATGAMYMTVGVVRLWAL